MRLSTWALSAVLLLSDAASAKAIYHPSRLWSRSDDYDEVMRRTVLQFEGQLERRSPVAAESLDNGSTASITNATITTACEAAVSNITTVSNAAGFAGCYNILGWDTETALFQADLRVYQQTPATGNFSGLSISQIMVTLNYPDIVQFKSLVKRSTVNIVKRDNSSVQIQQYSLAGSLRQAVDLSKLNQTLLASLMVPQITLEAKQTQSSNLMSTNMTAADSAWFVTGLFTNLSSQALQVANPATAAAAVIAAKPFSIPGKTLGIFPTGLIVTSVWTFLFLLAFGLGTVGRMKARSIYRRRIMGLASRGHR